MDWELVEPSGLPSLAQKAASWKAAVIDVESTGVEPYLGDRLLGLGISPYGGEDYYYLNIGSDGVQLNELDVRPLWEILERIALIGHNIKFDLHMLATLGWEPTQSYFEDTMVGVRLCEEDERPPLNLEDTAKRWLGYEYEGPEIVAQVKSGKKLDQLSAQQAGLKCVQDVRLTKLLRRKYMEQFGEDERLKKLYIGECQLTRDLYDIERRGQLIDQEYLSVMDERVAEAMDTRITVIRDMSGQGEFKPNSAPQVRELMDTAGIQPVKYTPKGQASWDKEALLAVRHLHPLALNLAQWRSLMYLQSGVIDRCKETIAAGHDALHGQWKQTTVTGRLSSSNPNRQNDPHGWLQLELHGDGDDVLKWATGEDAVEQQISFERLFLARPGHTLVAADYKQIEMFVLGFFMKDPTFNRWLDSGNVHFATAQDIWGDGEKYYARGKQYNFAMVFGLGNARLAQNLGLSSPDEAQLYREEYFAHMPGYRRFHNRIRRALEREGCVRNIFGRYYYKDPELAYQALNYMVQGSAGDFVKFRLPATRKLRRQMKLHVLKTTHDDYVFEIPHESMEGLPDLLKLLRQSPFKRDLELDVETTTSSMVDWEPWEVPSAA